MEDKVKNLCAPIPAGLHARVREEQEASGQTLGQYMPDPGPVHDMADPNIL